MKSLTSFLLLILLIIPINIVYSQTNIKTWTETTVQDFSDNQLNNLIVTNNSGGEVQLPHPLVKTIEDFNDQTVGRFFSKDSSGNYVTSWIQGSNIFVKKFSADGRDLSPSLQVNDQEGLANDYSFCRAALMNDGTFMVVWSYRTTDYNLYGQLFNENFVRVGNNFIIKASSEYSNSSPNIFANNFDNNFWVFYPKGNFDSSKIQIQKVDKSGNKVADAFFLNPETISSHELWASVASGKNCIWVCWDGGNGVSSWDIDVYLRRFNYDGTPMGDAIIVNDKVDKLQGGNDICVDNKSNLFVVWIDERDAVEPITSGQYNVLGQIFNSVGNRIGSNFKLNFIGNRQENRYCDVDFINDEFQVSWFYWDAPNRRDLVYVNKWKFDPRFSGEMVSTVFDASPSGSAFNKILWDAESYPGTNLKFQIRSGKTLGELNNSSWYGPFGLSDFYTNNIGEEINSVHNEDRYIQYKAFFTSVDGNSFILKSISVQYNTFDTIPPLSPAGLTVNPSHASIILYWQPNNNHDLLGYKLYRGIQSNIYDDSWEVIIPKGTLSYKDTSAVVNKKFYYVITAVDSSHNESGYSNEVSGTAYGINIYVSTDGSSNGDGSINNPVKTIQQGINASVFGDTVRVLPGIYNDIFTMKDGVSLVGTDAEQCKINTPISASDSCVIKNLTITKSLICNSVSPIITENIFRGTSLSYAPAIDINAISSPRIIKNFITECEMGINIRFQCNPEIKNNIIKAEEVGIEVDFLDVPVIINNTIIAEKLGAIRLHSFDSVQIENNILIKGIFQSNSPSNKINYNDFWKSNSSDFPVPETNIFLDPQFANMDLQDYHLLSTSPCINAGNPNPAFNDIDGTRNDIGAYGGPDPIQSNLSSQLTKSISVSNLSGYPRDTVSVFLSLDNTNGLSKADLIIEVDNSILTYINAIFTNATQNFQMQSQLISEREVKFSLSSSASIQSDSKEILEVKYLVDENSFTGDASSISLKDVFLFDANLRNINIRSIANGAFIVDNIYESENYLYVDSKSTNPEDGSRQNPFNTIMEAIEAASMGDTIFVYGGNYYGSVFMKEGITLVGSGASVTNIIVTGDSTALIFKNLNKSVVTGFTIKRDENHYPSIPILTCEGSSPVIKKNRFETSLFGDFGIYFWNSSNAIIEQNYIKGVTIDIMESNPIIRNNFIEAPIGTSTINCRNGSAPEIKNNTLEGTYGNSTIAIYDANTTLKNNLIYCNDGGFGLFINNANSSMIYNNVIIDRSMTGTGIRVLNSSGNEIINNSIITRGKGIEEQNSSSAIFNNIIVNNNNFGFSLSSSNYDYNDVWNNFVNYNGKDPGINDISSDPLFIDTANGDYRVSSNSPCRNAGNPGVEYNDVDGSRNDIGAYGGPYADSSWIYSNGSSLAIDSITALSVDTIQITITGEDIKGIAEVNLTLSFDPSLLYIISANSGNLTKSFSLEKTNLESGSVNLFLKSNKGIIEENGELIELQIAINASQSLNTFLHFDNATVRDEATCLGNILNLKDGQIKITTDVNNNYSDAIPKSYSLFQNYPNPFNPVTTIRYELPKESDVKLVIYNLLGEKVTELVNSFQKAGKYEVKWNAQNFACGVYFYSIQTGNFSSTKKLLLLK